MNRLAYFRFYPCDWLASPTVNRMTLEEQGAYGRLLAHAWQMGGLPNDRRELALLLGLEPGSERAERILTKVLDLAWKPHPDDPRALINDRQEKERSVAEAAYQRKCRALSRARESNPKNNILINPLIPTQYSTQLITQNSEYRSTTTTKTLTSGESATREEPDHPETMTGPGVETTNQRVATKVRPRSAPRRPPKAYESCPEFMEFLAIYPRKTGDTPASIWGKWQARTTEGIPAREMIDGAQRYAKWFPTTGWDPKYVKAGKVFLGPDRCWEDPWLPPETEDEKLTKILQAKYGDAYASRA